MNIVVFLKMVPDVVEELIIGEDGRSLDTEWLRMILSNPDEHALEQALLLKQYGGTVTVVAPEAPEVDEVLFTALAKGADRAVKLSGDWVDLRGPAIANLYSSWLSLESGQLTSETLIFTGSQAVDDLEGEVAPYLADILDIPYIGVVTGVTVDEGRKRVVVIKEFAGGLRGEFEVFLPAVLGIQSAEKPPRYVPVAKIRSVMRSAQIETVEISPSEFPMGVSVERLFEPEATGRAEMLKGTPEEVVARITEILEERGLI